MYLLRSQHDKNVRMASTCSLMLPPAVIVKHATIKKRQNLKIQNNSNVDVFLLQGIVVAKLQL